MIAYYLSMLEGELFTHSYIFYEPVGNMGKLRDLDMGLDPIEDQFFETPMIQKETEAFNEVLVEGYDKLEQNFMNNLVINNNAGI